MTLSSKFNLRRAALHFNPQNRRIPIQSDDQIQELSDVGHLISDVGRPISDVGRLTSGVGWITSPSLGRTYQILEEKRRDFQSPSCPISESDVRSDRIWIHVINKLSRFLIVHDPVCTLFFWGNPSTINQLNSVPLGRFHPTRVSRPGAPPSNILSCPLRPSSSPFLGRLPISKNLAPTGQPLWVCNTTFIGNSYLEATVVNEIALENIVSITSSEVGRGMLDTWISNFRRWEDNLPISGTLSSDVGKNIVRYWKKKNSPNF